MGIKIDKELNATIHGKEALISTPDSKVKVVVIPTDEELMIAHNGTHTEVNSNISLIKKIII